MTTKNKSECEHENLTVPIAYCADCGQEGTLKGWDFVPKVTTSEKEFIHLNIKTKSTGNGTVKITPTPHESEDLGEQIRKLKVYDKHCDYNINFTGEFWFDDDANTLTLQCDKVMGDYHQGDRFFLVNEEKSVPESEDWEAGFNPLLFQDYNKEDGRYYTNIEKLKDFIRQEKSKSYQRGREEGALEQSINKDQFYEFIKYEAKKEGYKEVLDYLQKNHLDYCKEQNGLNYCKNCGLSSEDIIKHFKIKL